MRCEEIEKLMPDYIGGDISASQRQHIEQHLSHCARCQKTLKTYKQTRQHLSSFKESPVPADFTEATMTKVKVATESRFQQWLRPAFGAAAAVIIIVVLLVTQPWGLNPQSVMARAYAATEGLQSYRIYSSTTSTVEGETSTQTSRVAFAAPDLYRAEVVRDGDAIEFIASGGKLYALGGSGSTVTIAWPGTSIIDKETTLDMLDMLTDLEQLPDEQIEGVNCLHFRGRVDMERMIEKQKAALDPADPGYEELIESMEQMRDLQNTVELWIGKEDYSIRQVIHDMVGFPLHGTSMAIVKYYDFNEPVEIEPPLDADGKLLPGWRLVASYPAKRAVFLTSQATSSIHGEDPAHQQISYRITITNVGEEVASNVRVKVRTRATNEESGSVMIEAEPSTPVPVDLRAGESETYNVSWEYDASHTSKEELARLVDYSRVFTKCTTPAGVEDVQVFSTGAPYPLKSPPTRELVAQYEQAREEADFPIYVPTNLPEGLELGHFQVQAMPDGSQMLILTYGDPGSQHIRFSQRKFDIESAENFEAEGFSRFTIMNISGYWKQGVLRQADIDDPSTQYWDMNKIQMFWDEGDMTYQLAARDVSVEELMLFAASLVEVD